MDIRIFLGPMESQFLIYKCWQSIGPSPRYFVFDNFLVLQKLLGWQFNTPTMYPGTVWVRQNVLIPKFGLTLVIEERSSVFTERIHRTQCCSFVENGVVWKYPKYHNLNAQPSESPHCSTYLSLFLMHSLLYHYRAPSTFRILYINNNACLMAANLIGLSFMLMNIACTVQRILHVRMRFAQPYFRYNSLRKLHALLPCHVCWQHGKIKKKHEYSWNVYTDISAVQWFFSNLL